VVWERADDVNVRDMLQTLEGASPACTKAIRTDGRDAYLDGRLVRFGNDLLIMFMEVQGRRRHHSDMELVSDFDWVRIDFPA
jgi:hypothetical protein